MSEAVYNELLASATELIEQFGRDVTYRSRGDFVDATQPWRGTTLGTAVTIKAAIFDSKASDHIAFPDVTFSRRALVAGNAFTTSPSAGDQITDGDNAYGIAEIITYAPGTVTVAFALLLTTER